MQNPPITFGSTFNARHIIKNKVVSSFEYLLANAPLGGLLTDDIRLGITIKAISFICTIKEQLITNPQRSTLTIIIFSTCLITNWKLEISKNSQAGEMQANM
ncbi:hypothetical protein O181_013361 [Austropuccinia psidii MF-1]|uniref:SNF2 N-terminal domain-containing protein n=1 Tax=Austropuccinia psidii MF-1 TaxID=1389203 RepID=A0A9Q3BZJ8_9BASI|nr:hypothetical protein [Austropuccinia psidii MF-1]